MAGFGCCTGNNSFVPRNIGSGGGSPSGDRPNALAVGCDPFTVDTTVVEPPGAYKWPPWVKKAGCGFISVLNMNEIMYNKKGRVFTPWHLKAMRECYEACSWYDPTGRTRPDQAGVMMTQEGIRCWLKCKTELMEKQFAVTVNARFFSWGGGGVGKNPPRKDNITNLIGKLPRGLCPPLCVDTEVVLMLMLARKVFSGRTGKEIGSSYSPHAVRGKTVCCNPGNKICFDVEDYNPQIPATGRICVDSDGNIVEIPKDKLPPGGKEYGGEWQSGIHNKGGCKQCFSSVVCGHKYKTGGGIDPKTKKPRGLPCFESDPGNTWVLGVYTESTATFCQPTFNPQGSGEYHCDW